MSIERREEVLARLFAILEAINGPDGFVTAKRNRALLDNDACPAVIQLDGDERVSNTAMGRGRQKMSPVLTTFTPQIFILLKYKKPQNIEVGQLLNSFRGKVLRAIANDAQLLALVGPNGDIGYDGCETDLKTGMPMEGQMQINLSISAPFNPYN